MLEVFVTVLYMALTPCSAYRIFVDLQKQLTQSFGMVFVDKETSTHGTRWDMPKE